jgi:hypothetical protein
LYYIGILALGVSWRGSGLVDDNHPGGKGSPIFLVFLAADPHVGANVAVLGDLLKELARRASI